MGNPLWVSGRPSANPSGRPKHSVRSVKGMVERFVTRNITPTKLQRMFNTLSEKDKLDMLMQLLPYTIAKVSADGISKEEVEKLYAMVEKGINSNEHGKAI